MVPSNLICRSCAGDTCVSACLCLARALPAERGRVIRETVFFRRGSEWRSTEGRRILVSRGMVWVLLLSFVCDLGAPVSDFVEGPGNRLELLYALGILYMTGLLETQGSPMSMIDFIQICSEAVWLAEKKL